MNLFKRTQKKAFTLIELLIVIALLGALAVGLLATVDPFEQLKKGTDTSIRNTAAELFNSYIRYYASRGAFPTSMTAGMTAVPASAASMTNAIEDIGDAGELKTDFIALAGLNNLGRILVSVPQTDKVVVCVQPQSKSFRNDQNSKFNNAGTVLPSTTCPNPTSTSCFVCFQ